jgi:gamma-glutamyltranspeptidase/glutathione hydrolase
MVSTQGRAATQAAQAIYAQGGNIIDAAIAASFAIGVERPHSTGIGGGGFLLYREAATKKVYVLDFRERAPLTSSKNIFLDQDGSVIPNASSEGIRSVATPGFLKAMVELHRKFGKLPLALVMQPAVKLAEQGLVVYPSLAEAISKKRDLLEKDPESRKIFLHANGKPYWVGERLFQKNLAATLRNLAEAALDEWAIEEFNQKIADESKRRSGLLSIDDLSSYQVRWLEPLVSSFGAYQIVTMPPPSGGGLQVLETLNILDHFDLNEEAPQSARALHLFADASQLAFADRSEYGGDPAFIKVPVRELTSKSYGLRQSKRIDVARHHPSTEIKAGDVSHESVSTTHFSMMDDQGGVVVSTQTINDSFGSGITVPGLGVVLNDEMDDFSVKPGVGNIYGAVSGSANAIAPGKTPLSSMVPTIVLKDAQPVLALGAPGGTRIGSCVAEVALNYLQYNMSLYDAVSAFRVHHQWMPDVLMVDAPGPGVAVLSALRDMGHVIELGPDAVPCRVMAVARENQGKTVNLVGVSDPRDHGSSAGN